jgi:hypothetical protein
MAAGARQAARREQVMDTDKQADQSQSQPQPLSDKIKKYEAYDRLQG